MLKTYLGSLVSLLFLVCALPAKEVSPPQRRLGEIIASESTPDGTLTVYERGIAFDVTPDEIELDGLDEPMTLRVTYQSQTPAGQVTIVVELELPVVNPNEQQMQAATAKLQRMVTAMQVAFPPIPTN